MALHIYNNRTTITTMMILAFRLAINWAGACLLGKWLLHATVCGLCKWWTFKLQKLVDVAVVALIRMGTKMIYAICKEPLKSRVYAY